jgi:Ca2+-binding RTX toxin-like protein
LELRQLLAATVGWDAGTQVVSIVADGAHDQVVITSPTTTTIRIQVAGSGQWDYVKTFVSRIDFWGGNGNDQFDNQTEIAARAFGQAGNDWLSGGSGNDLLNGGNGDDTLQGNHGDDDLLGSDGLDWLEGGEGDDYLSGYTGNDQLFGGAGNDIVYGQAGDDVCWGDEGDDRVRGHAGNDQLFGGDDQDFMMGDQGDDDMDGGRGDDRVFGFLGNDILRGGDGHDQLYGSDDQDQLFGGTGDDVLRAGNGNDQLFGEAGNDRLNGEGGDDLLRGGQGVDVLRGGTGNDSLQAGDAAATDTLYGEDGMDRFLVQSGDFVSDLTADDATLRFVDRTSSWNDREIEILDGAFAQLFATTGNNRLLRDSLDPNPLSFFKYSDLGGAAGINYLQTSGTQTWNNGQWQWTYTYTREIRLLDWNENSSWYNQQFQSVTLHEIGHNWDSALEMSQISPQGNQWWQAFLNLSGWQNSNPNSNAYTQSHDGQWWYLNTAVFAESYGQTNPYEDWATIWEYYFNPGSDANVTAALQPKLDRLQALFDAM